MPSPGPPGRPPLAPGTVTRAASLPIPQHPAIGVTTAPSASSGRGGTTMAKVELVPMDSGKKKKTEQSTAYVGALCGIFVVVALFNRVFQKLMTYPMHNYPFFLNLITTFAYVPFCFAYIAPMQCFGTAISRAQTLIPKHKVSSDEPTCAT
jgi:hypothetical protein